MHNLVASGGLALGANPPLAKQALHSEYRHELLSKWETYLILIPNGIASDDTFNRVFARLDKNQFK